MCNSENGRKITIFIEIKLCERLIFIDSIWNLSNLFGGFVLITYLCDILTSYEYT